MLAVALGQSDTVVEIGPVRVVAPAVEVVLRDCCSSMRYWGLMMGLVLLLRLHNWRVAATVFVTVARIVVVVGAPEYTEFGIGARVAHLVVAWRLLAGD